AEWSSKPFKLPEQLPQAGQWTRYPSQEWAFNSGRWQVLVLAAQRTGDNAPDSSILVKIPDAVHVAYVTLEPIRADRDGYALLQKVVRALALATAGVWVDPYGEAYAHDEGQFE